MGISAINNLPEHIIDHEALGSKAPGSINLGDLADVTISNPGNGEVLVYTGGTWINQTLAEAGIAIYYSQASAPTVPPAGVVAIWEDTDAGPGSASAIYISMNNQLGTRGWWRIPIQPT